MKALPYRIHCQRPGCRFSTTARSEVRAYAAITNHVAVAHMVDSESIERAKAAQRVERAQVELETGVTIREDGSVEWPQNAA